MIRVAHSSAEHAPADKLRVLGSPAPRLYCFETLPTSQERSPLESSRAATRAALAIAPGVMAAGIAGGIAFPILPSFGLRAGLPVAFIGVILAANRAARVVANPFVGQLTDRIGGRRTLLLGLILQIVVMGFYW